MSSTDGALPSKTARYLVLTIAIAAGLTFSRAFVSDYVAWDDDRLVLGNVYLTAPFLEAMKGVWAHSFDGDYLPIPFLSYWLELKIWGFDPFPQHVVNWLIHLANIWLVHRWLSAIRVTSALALVVTMIFALHPLQTESVLWIGERKGLLSSFFLLLGLVSLEGASASRQNSWRSIAAWTVCFTLSCLCKVTGVFLPFVLVLYARFIDRRSWQESLRSHLAACLIAVGFCVLRYVTYSTTVGGVGAEALALTHWLSLPIVIPTAIGHYVVSLVYPAGLSIIYPSFAETRYWALKCAIGVGYLVLVAHALVRRRRGPETLLAIWSLALLLPVLSVIPRLNFVNDRYMYLPIIGMAGFLGSIAAAWTTVRPRVAWMVGSACVAVLLGYLSFARSDVWRDGLPLWQDTVQKTPTAQLAWNNLGVAQLAHGQVRDAEQSFLTAARAIPHQNAMAFVNLAHIYLDSSQPTFDPARAYQVLTSGLQFAVTLDDQFALRFNIGAAQLRMNQTGAAAETFRSLLADVEKASSNGYHRILERQVRDALSRIGG